MYSSQAAQKATEAGIETQTFLFHNNTIYNITKSKNLFTHRQANQTWLAYNIQNNIFVNCGKSGQTIKGFNQSQGGSNPTWTVKGNAFNFDGEDTSAAETTGDEVEPVEDSVAGIVEFTDADAGDFNGVFTLAEGAIAPESLGAPMWTITFTGATIADGYYLAGNMTDWKPKEGYKLELNDKAEGVEEYMISVELEADAQFKVVKVEGESQTWYPAGEGNAYGENGELTAGAGLYNVYFRPNADGGDDWFNKVIYVVDALTDGINAVAADNSNAVIYNLKGQRVNKMQKGLYIINGKKQVVK
jgi:hypothetical protein